MVKARTMLAALAAVALALPGLRLAAQPQPNAQPIAAKPEMMENCPGLVARAAADRPAVFSMRR